VCPNRWPLVGDDAVNAGISQRFLGCGMPVDLMTTEHAVEFGPQSLDCAPAGVVEEVCAELHRYAVKVVERMGKHQALGFGVERGSLGLRFS
jgi:hypothetical protein